MKQRRLSEIGISVAGLAEELRRDRSVIHWRRKALRIPTFKALGRRGHMVNAVVHADADRIRALYNPQSAHDTPRS